MRLRSILLALPFVSFAVLAPPMAAESTKTLKLELAPSGGFVVENLAGTMRVTAGGGDKVVAVATIHAESDQLAGSVRFEQVTGEHGLATLRVIYPTDQYTTFKYPRQDESAGGFLSSMFGGSSTSTKYAGQKVKVSDGSGVLLYVDVEVRLPQRAVEGTFRNLVGRIDGEGVEGTLVFDGASADVTLSRGKGDITADTGSGDVKATDMDGAFAGDTGSGDVDVEGFHGETIKCDTGSGDVSISSGSARKVILGTGSGDIHMKDLDAQDVIAKTGSGDVTLETAGENLVSLKADTGSGDVTVRLSQNASFEATASLGSGDILNHFRDAQPIVKDREVIGYRRGDARTRIEVDTGSGNFLLEPGI